MFSFLQVPLIVMIFLTPFHGPGQIRPGSGDDVSKAWETFSRLGAAGRAQEAENFARDRWARVIETGQTRSIEAAGTMRMLVQALWRNGKAHRPEALQLIGQAIELTEELGNTETEFHGHLLTELGHLRRERGEFHQARQLFEEARKKFAKISGEQSSGVALSHVNLASVFYEMENSTRGRALHHAETAVTLSEKIHGAESIETAQALVMLAHSVANMPAESGRGPEIYDRILKIYSTSYGPDHPAMATALARVAHYYTDTFDYEIAIPLYEKAAQIQEGALGPGSPVLAHTLLELALTYWHLGEPRMISLAQRAVEIELKASGGLPSPGVATALEALGLYQSDRDPVVARQSLERALEIFSELLGEEHERTAMTRLRLANLHTDHGDYATASSHISAARFFFDKYPEHGWIGELWESEAGLAEASRNLNSARRLWARAIEVSSPETPARAGLLVHLSRLATFQNEPDEATARLAVAERILADQGLAWRAMMARLQHAQGGAEARKGNWPAAAAQLEESLAIEQELSCSDSPLLAPLLLDLAAIQSAQGQHQVSTETALRAEKLSREQMILVLRGSSEREGLRYAAERPAGLHLALTAPNLNEADNQAIYDHLIRSRALVQDEMSRRQVLTRSLGHDAELQRLQDLQGQLGTLLMRGGNRRLKNHQELIGRIRAEKEELERSLALRGATTPPEIGFEEVLGALPAETALVSLMRVTPPKLSWTFDTGAARYIALVQTSNGAAPRRFELGDAQQIDSLVSQWRRAVMKPSTTTDWLDPGTRLRQLVWDPIAPLLEGSRQVLIVPDGELGLVNFAALPTSNDQFLVENGPLIHYLSTERELVQASGQQYAGKGFLALGNPVIGSRQTSANIPALCVAGGPGGLKSLPGAELEVRRLASLWEQSQEGSTVLTGSAASEATFRTQAPGRRIVHLATHGYVLDSICADVTNTRGIGGVAPLSYETLSPLSLAGIVLSATTGSRDPASDGIVTAEDISTINLEGVEWAVLSACDTGSGTVQAGEGVLGLRRAFKVAGVGTVVMSLWSVDDDSTRQWMRNLYTARLQENQPTAEAVRTASRRFLEQQRRSGQSTHPFYWAAFVASGDWR